MIDPAPADERPKILVVDDEREILIALEDLFDEHYRVIAHASPKAALAAIDEHPDIAVILSDQRMPEMPGNVFLSHARKKSRAETLLLTGYADLSAVVSAVNDGAIGGYAQKPWEPEGLRTMVAAAAERHRLARALAFEQAIFAGLSAQSSDRISVVDAAGHVVRSNQAIDGTIDPADRNAAQGPATDREEKRTEADGAVRWMRTQRIPFVAEGSAPHLLKIETDQTARRLIEQKLHQSEKLQALGTLAGGIAHDFNNLLAAVIGNLELASRRAGDDEKLARFLTNATEAARRGTALSQRLLSFSRQRDLAAESFCPNDAVRSIEDLIVRSMAGLVTLAYRLEEGAWPVRVDRGQFELALLNLCINARDAMPGGGEIEVATRNAGDGLPAGLTGEYVAISVKDTGTGIPPDVMARVFEPFFTTKDLGHGTGLGLPMVHAMAESAGGTTTIDSTPGAGTTVTIWLARVAASLRDGAHDTIDPRAIPPLRVLIAEDDPDVRQVAAAHLDDLGHAHVAVESGIAALALLERGERFDLVVTDHAMPGLSGCELALEIGARWPALPVLLVTGFAEIGAAPAGVSVLTKPFTREELVAAIVQAVRTNEPDR
jgi:signal transduction histidine kinase